MNLSRLQGTIVKMLFQKTSTSTQRIKTQLRRINSVAMLCLMALSSVLLPSAAQAQTDPDDLPSRLRRVEFLMGSNQLVEARPDMIWLKSRVDSSMHPRLDFYIALSFVFEYYETESKDPLSTASEKFRQFKQQYPEHEFLKLVDYNLGDIEATLGNYEEALKYYIPLYNDPGQGAIQLDRKEVLNKILLIYVATQEWEAGMPFFEKGMRTLGQPGRPYDCRSLPDDWQGEER